MYLYVLKDVNINHLILKKNISNCLCNVKKEVNTKPEKGNIQTYIMSSFLESNFGVIKCYNLVFSFKGNLSNIGFWIFGIMLIIHIPLYILNFIIGTKNLINYILKEMDDKGYTIDNDLEEEKIEKSKINEKESEKDNNLNLIKYNADNYKNNFVLTSEGKNNPPKKRSSTNKIIQKLETMKKIKNTKKFKISKINLNEYGNKNEIRTYIKRNTYAFRLNNNININLSNLNINNMNIANLNISNINSNENIKNDDIKIEEINESNEIEIKPKKIKRYSLILINANNETNFSPFKSDYVINNFDYDEAIIYEDRAYCRIFFILLIAKENVLNMIFFNPP